MFKIAIRVIVFVLLIYIVISAFMELSGWKRYGHKAGISSSEISR